MKTITGIKYNGYIFWFLGESDIWFLNLDKIDTTLIDENALTLRKNFISIDKSNILQFLNQNNEFLLPVKDLKNCFKKQDDDLYLSLFIDFDKKVFYDNFPEPNNFNGALNTEWNYSYEDLDNVVDEKEQYWKS